MPRIRKQLSVDALQEVALRFKGQDIMTQDGRITVEMVVDELIYTRNRLHKLQESRDRLWFVYANEKARKKAEGE